MNNPLDDRDYTKLQAIHDQDEMEGLAWYSAAPDDDLLNVWLQIHAMSEARDRLLQVIGRMAQLGMTALALRSRRGMGKAE